jgi:hypothetical protein
VRSELYPRDVVIEQLFASVYEEQQHKIQRHLDIAVLLQSFRRRTFYFSRKMRIASFVNETMKMSRQFTSS